MKQEIIKRNIFDNIVPYLGSDNIIVLHGSRQVGKTYIMYLLRDYLDRKNKLTKYIDLEDSRLVDLLNNGLEEFLLYLQTEVGEYSENKKIYIFIDEIQYLENPSPFLKLIADHHKNIQLIVSGSSSFAIKSKFSDSLVGRTVDFEIFNLSFEEFLRFKGLKYKLNKLSKLHEKEVVKLYYEYIKYGGYPKIVLEKTIEKKEKYILQIIDTYIKKDIIDISNIKNIIKFNKFLKVLAEQSGQLLNVTSIAKTVGLAKQTVEEYLFILENTYIIKLLPPFSRSSKVEVSKAPKIFFYDTGLLQMLWLSSFSNVNIGNIFETSVFTEIVKKYGVEKVRFWRNKNQNEIDFILKQKKDILPIKVKESFHNFRKSALTPFLNKYNIKDFRVVGLKGEKENKYDFYPWEL